MTRPLKLAIRASVKGGAFERAEKEDQMGCNDICSPIAASPFSSKTSPPMHYGLSNVIIRDQKFAKVRKSKPLLLAHF